VAPEDSAVGRWAVRHDFSGFFRPDQLEAFAAWARDLRIEDGWQARREIVRHFADDAFSPEKIQATFAGSLLRQ
jgi:hypothetical protein